MNLPSKHSNTGRTLRAMYGASPMTAGAIRNKANFHPNTEITARIRELRDKYQCEIPKAQRVQLPGGKAIYLYHLVSVSHWMSEALNKEFGRGIAA